MTTPRLIEREVKSYIGHSLNSCRESRIKTYSFFFNCIVLFIFFFIFGAALYCSYYKKETPYAKYAKYVKNQEYVLSKIHDYQVMSTNSSITNLPNSYSPILPKI
jgi:hypothetical protein